MEKNNVSFKKILLIFGITFIIILALSILFFININKDKETSRVIKANVKYVGNDYLIVTDKKNKDDYIITIDDLDDEEEYNIGDQLSLTIDNINKNKDPIEAEAKSIKIISKSETNEEKITIVEEPKENQNKTDNSNNNNKTIDTNNNNTNNNSNIEANNTVGNENDVISYFNSVEQEVDRSSANKSLSEKAKSGFVSIIDFLFYDKPIKGVTYKGVTNSIKLKLLKLAVIIDEKIETHFPGYKESLSSKYQDVKTKIITKYLDKTTEVCSKNEDTCATAKEGLSDLKRNFSLTWSFIKDISGIGLSKLKAWYEIWRQT
ncbi:MAG: hypothetical protein VZS44_02570 [Bacilli bacterium]|nr:hypothetical protein [Bacilli bacterium]